MPPQVEVNQTGSQLVFGHCSTAPNGARGPRRVCCCGCCSTFSCRQDPLCRALTTRSSADGVRASQLKASTLTRHAPAGHFTQGARPALAQPHAPGPDPLAGRVRALPFLTALAPAARHCQQRERQQEADGLGAATDAARHRWRPGRKGVVAGDGGFAALDLLAAPSRRGVHHPPAPRRRASRPGAASPARHQRTTPDQGQASGNPVCGAGRPPRHGSDRSPWSPARSAADAANTPGCRDQRVASQAPPNVFRHARRRAPRVLAQTGVRHVQPRIEHAETPASTSQSHPCALRNAA